MLYFEFLVILKIFFKNISNDSVLPLGGLYKTFIKVLHLFSNKSSIHRDSTSLQLMLRSSLILKLNTFLIYIETPPTLWLYYNNLEVHSLNFRYLFHLTMSQKNI